MRAVIVVPTTRQESIARFLDAWRGEFDGHHLIVVEDNPERSFELQATDLIHCSWEQIDQEFGAHAWIFPRRTDCIRSYGFYKAYQLAADMIVTLDDDCYPCTPRFLEAHYEHLTSPARSSPWVSTCKGLRPRGVPYENTSRKSRCVISHGLWTGYPDYDALTQLVSSRLDQGFEPINQVIPQGAYFPMCGMNLAWRPGVTPALYFLLMGKDWPFDRFGDIWCGILVKRICDHLGYAVKSGEPLVEHDRASNVWANLKKEIPAYEVNETFWQAVDSVRLTATTIAGAYRELSEKLPLRGEYWDCMRRSMKIWCDLFPKNGQELDAQPA
jgi:Reversibly glycosylated polypeptide